jgi:hypothetical protein
MCVYVRVSREGISQMEARVFAERSIGLVAWISSTEGMRPEFFRAVLKALRASRNVFGWAPDPLKGIAIEMQRLSATAEDDSTRGVFITVFLHDLELRDQLALFGISL